MRIILTNDFHHSEVTLYARGEILSHQQVRRAKKILCGMADCVCSDEAGRRGYGGDNERIRIDYDTSGMTAKPFAHVSK